MRLLSPEVCMVGCVFCGTGKPAAWGRRASRGCLRRRWGLAVGSNKCPPDGYNAAVVCKNAAFVFINASAVCKNGACVLTVGALHAAMDAGPGVVFRGCRLQALLCRCWRACGCSGPVVAGRNKRCKWGNVCWLGYGQYVRPKAQRGRTLA